VRAAKRDNGSPAGVLADSGGEPVDSSDSSSRAGALIDPIDDDE